MAVAVIETTLPGLTGFTLTLDLYPLGSDTAAASAISLTEASNRKCTYAGTTSAGLTGVHLAIVKEGSTVRGEGYVMMDDTTGIHRVVGSPYVSNIGGTEVNVDVSDIWTYTLRTLTHPTVQLPATVEDSDVTVYRGTKWSIVFTNLGALTGWTKLYFTVRTLEEQAEAQSQVQIKLTSPGAGTDGLLWLNGSSTVTAAHGSITVDDEPTGDITISLAAAASASCVPGIYYYDVKMITASNVTLLTIGGKLTISPDITRAVT